MNCIFGFSLFLLLLVALNIYFFYILNTEHKPAAFKLPIVKSDPIPPNVFREINEYLNRLPSQYHTKNSKFLPIQRDLINSFNSSGASLDSVWHNIETVSMGKLSVASLVATTLLFVFICFNLLFMALYLYCLCLFVCHQPISLEYNQSTDLFSKNCTYAHST